MKHVINFAPLRGVKQRSKKEYSNINNVFTNRVDKFKIPEFIFLPLKTLISDRVKAKHDQLFPDKLKSKIITHTIVDSKDIN